MNTLNFLFSGAAEPSCKDAADANDDGRLDLSDAVNTLNFLFGGGMAPAGWPECTADAKEDTLDCAATKHCK